MNDGQYYRHSISKRAAVDSIIKIAKVMSKYDSVYFFGYDGNRERQYDMAVRSLAEDVRRLKEEVEEYRNLKRVLEPLIKQLVR